MRAANRRRTLVGGIVAAVVCALVAPAGAQMTHRLKGSLKNAAGAPVAGGRVRAEALVGFRGEQFVGQKDFTVETSEKGEWNLLGLSSGIWLFAADGPAVVPTAIVLSVKFSQRQQVSAVGNSLNWALPIFAVPAAEHPLLAEAIRLYGEGKAEEASQALTVALVSDTPLPTVIAAGEMALALQKVDLAYTFFRVAAQKTPNDARVQLGLASAALMSQNWDAASKQLWTARDVAPKDQRAALGNAIAELQAIAKVQ